MSAMMLSSNYVGEVELKIHFGEKGEDQTTSRPHAYTQIIRTSEQATQDSEADYIFIIRLTTTTIRVVVVAPHPDRNIFMVSKITENCLL
jgi:hypothetical protein